MLPSRNWHAKAGRTQILGQTARIGGSDARKIIPAWTSGQATSGLNESQRVSPTADENAGAGKPQRGLAGSNLVRTTS
jgi:hypothetical protein